MFVSVRARWLSRRDRSRVVAEGEDGEYPFWLWITFLFLMFLSAKKLVKLLYIKMIMDKRRVERKRLCLLRKHPRLAQQGEVCRGGECNFYEITQIGMLWGYEWKDSTILVSFQLVVLAFSASSGRNGMFLWWRFQLDAFFRTRNKTRRWWLIKRSFWKLHSWLSPSLLELCDPWTTFYAPSWQAMDTKFLLTRMSPLRVSEAKVGLLVWLFHSPPFA